MSVIVKTLGALGFLFFFCFGLLSVSFASYENPSDGALWQFAKSQPQKRYGLNQAEGKNTVGGMLFQGEGILPKPARDLTRAPEFAQALPSVSAIRSVSTIGDAFKSSTLDFSPVLNL